MDRIERDYSTRQATPASAGIGTTRVGVVGAGYWGPKLVRNFAAMPEAVLAMVCDLQPARLQAIAEQFPGVRLTTDFEALLGSDLDAVMAHVHVSWLDPGKVRRITIVGSQKMAVYDDTAAAKLRVYDRGVEPGDNGELVYRLGETTSIVLPTKAEPLGRQCAHFLACAQSGARPRADGRHGLKVVRILEQADCSLQNSGHREELRLDVAGWAALLGQNPVGADENRVLLPR